MNRSFPQIRMRRRRSQKWLLETFSETNLLPKDLIQPAFITEAEELQITSMPGVKHYSLNSIVEFAKFVYSSGVKSMLLFPVVPHSKKSDCAKEAINKSNLVNRAIALIKSNVPELGVIADVALDPYTLHGHDGIVDDAGNVLNDVTVEKLCYQALSLARAGVDVVAPSDMMDGRVGKIRSVLDDNGFQNVLILSYAAKYNSKLYAPFREAIGSASNLGNKDKSSYQMDIRNSDEAMHEIRLDLDEGADWLMIKPGMTNLDIINRAKVFNMPIAAYQVSGEYSMISEYARTSGQAFIDIQLEFLTVLKRAGATHIACYNAAEVAHGLRTMLRVGPDSLPLCFS